MPESPPFISTQCGPSAVSKSHSENPRPRIPSGHCTQTRGLSVISRRVLPYRRPMLHQTDGRNKKYVQSGKHRRNRTFVSLLRYHSVGDMYRSCLSLVLSPSLPLSDSLAAHSPFPQSLHRSLARSFDRSSSWLPQKVRRHVARHLKRLDFRVASKHVLHQAIQGHPRTSKAEPNTIPRLLNKWSLGVVSTRARS